MMIEIFLNSKNSQRKKARQMQILFVALTIILIMIFLTPFYFLVTDPQAPRLYYQSSVGENIRVSSNGQYITSDWNFTFRLKNTDRVYIFFYESINANMLEEDGNAIGAPSQLPPLLQGTNTETDIVFKFRNVSFPITGWTETDMSKGGEACGKAKVTISMNWKLNINGGSKPRSRYTRLNVKCRGSIEFSFNNSQSPVVQFLDEDEKKRCDAHLIE